MVNRALLPALAFLAAFPGFAAPPETPRLSFAVLADIQYADRDTAGARAYRESLRKLAAAAEEINAARPDFVIQLGDAIDTGGMAALDRVLALFGRIRSPKRHVAGNHDFAVPRADLLRRLELGPGWYDFTSGGWRFVVLDGMDLSVARPEGERMLASLKQAGSPNASPWNGGIGEEQKAWLEGVLADAARKRECAVVFCHFPVLEASSTAPHLLWNHREIVAVLARSASVAAWFNGHDHRGGYAERNGIHYVTFPGMVESGQAGSWTLVRVFGDRMELRGAGSAPSRVLRLTRTGAQ